ncbi:MAG: geranylgeranyl reductase family protein [Planctomycetes bacterium]|nr:geranylgeranyl reductase family protein [Planctomycetota bacterium]
MGERFDVVVIGAGPAGAAAGTSLARGGARVLLIDRDFFPREKPCGGALSAAAVRRLRAIGIEPADIDIVESREVEVSFRGRRSVALDLLAGGGFTTRSVLDARIVDTFRAAGGEFRDGVRAFDVDPFQGLVRTRRGSCRADLIIAADGARGAIARRFFPAPRTHFTLALCAAIHPPEADLARLGIRARCETGFMGDGYGWVFPKGDHLSAGVFTAERHPRALRGAFEAFLRRAGLDRFPRGPVRGAPIPIGRPKRRYRIGRLVAVGDAAGLADNVIGEGIPWALLSGRLAARRGLDFLAGVAGALRSYDEDLRRRVVRRLRAARILASVIRVAPGIAFRLLVEGGRFRRIGDTFGFGRTRNRKGMST